MGISSILGAVIALNSGSAAYFTSPFFACVTAVVAASNTLGRTLHTSWAISIGCTFAATSMLAVRAVFGSSYAATIATLFPVCFVLAYPDYHPVIKRFALAVSGMIAFRILKDENTDVLFGFKITLTGIVGNGCAILALLLPFPRFATERVASSVDDLSALVSIMYCALIQAFLLAGNKEHANVFLGQYSTAALLFHQTVEEVKEHVEFAQYELHGWHLVKDMRATVEFFESLHEKLEGMDMALRSHAIASSELTDTLRGPFHDLGSLQRLVLMDVSIPLFSSLDAKQHQAYAELQEALQKALKSFDGAVYAARGKAFYSPGTTGNLGPQLSSITATNFFLFNAVRYALSVQRLVLHMIDVDNTASTALRKFDVEETRPFVDDPHAPEAPEDGATTTTEIVSPRHRSAAEMEKMIRQLRSGTLHSSSSTTHTGHRSKTMQGSAQLVVVPAGGGSDSEGGAPGGSAPAGRRVTKSTSMRIELANPTKAFMRHASGYMAPGPLATAAPGALAGSHPSSQPLMTHSISMQVMHAASVAAAANAAHEHGTGLHRKTLSVTSIPEMALGDKPAMREEASLCVHPAAPPHGATGEHAAPSAHADGEGIGPRGLAVTADVAKNTDGAATQARASSAESLAGSSQGALHPPPPGQRWPSGDTEKPRPRISGLVAAAMPVSGEIEFVLDHATDQGHEGHDDDHGHHNHDHDHQQMTHPLNEISLDGPDSTHGGPGRTYDRGGSDHSSTSGVMVHHPWASSSNTLLALQHRSVSSQELEEIGRSSNYRALTGAPGKGLTIVTAPPGGAMSPKGAAATGPATSCQGCDEHRWREAEQKQSLGECLYGQVAWLVRLLWGLVRCCCGGFGGGMKRKGSSRRVRMSGDRMRSPSPKKAGFGPFGIAEQAPADAHGADGHGHHSGKRHSGKHNKKVKRRDSAQSAHELGGQEMGTPTQLRLNLFGGKKPYSKLHGGQKAKKRPSQQQEEEHEAVLPSRPPAKEWSLNLTLELNGQRVKGALKKAGALVIAGWVSNDAFAAITVGFIVGGHVGASFHISVLRVQGAVLGAVLAYFGLAITSAKVAVAAVLGTLVGMFGYIRGSHVHAYVGLVAAFMVPVIMLGFNPATAKPGYTVDDYVLDRIKFTVSGVLVYVAVELLVWPQRATTLARNNMIQTISNEMAYFSALYDSYISMDCAHCRSRTADDATTLKLAIKKALPHLVEQINEAKAEPELWNPAFPTEIYMRIVKNQKTLLRLLVRLHSSLRAASVVDSGTELLYQRLIRPMQPNFLALRADVLVILEAILWALKLGGLSANVQAGLSDSHRGGQPGQNAGGNNDGDGDGGGRTPSMGGSTAGGTFLHSLMLMMPSYVNKLQPTLDEFDKRHVSVATELQRLHAADASAGILSNQAIYSFHGLVFTVKAIAKELVELELNCRNLLLAENMPSVHDLNTHEKVAAAGRALEVAPAHASGKSPGVMRRIVFGGRKQHGASSTTGQGTTDMDSSDTSSSDEDGSSSSGQESDELNGATRDGDRFVPAFGSSAHNV